MSHSPGDFKQLNIPEAHLAAIGDLINAWAVLEFNMDLMIWELMGCPQQVGACVTAQLMSAYPRLKAIRSLIVLRGGSEEASKEIGRFGERIGGLTEARNRAAHDPRMFHPSDGTVHHLKITAQNKPAFGFVPETAEELNATTEAILEVVRDFMKARGRILAEVAALPAESRPPLHRIQQVTQAPANPASAPREPGDQP